MDDSNMFSSGIWVESGGFRLLASLIVHGDLVLGGGGTGEFFMAFFFSGFAPGKTGSGVPFSETNLKKSIAPAKRRGAPVAED